MSYETFAFIYDEVMDTSLYEKWLAFTKRHLPAGTKEVLELACGTGALAVELAKDGYQVTALDLSEEMLMIATERALQAEVNIQFVQGNMQDLAEIGQYELITCYSDSICYMEDDEAVQQVFDEVHQALEEKGTFIFDVHSIYKIDEVFPEYSYHYQTDEFAFLWESYAGENSHSIEHFLTFFVQTQEDAEVFLRKDELHQERTYPLEHYVRMLENAGFTDIQLYADFSDEAPTEKSERWFFVCRKNDDE